MRWTALGRFCAVAVAIAIGCAGSSATAATILANWTFEVSIPATAGPFAAENGVNAGTSQALGGTGGTYSSPAGNGVGSLHSFSSNGWDVGDWFQFKAPTTGFSGLFLQFDQAGSNTGPKDFKVQTSTDGTTFTDLAASAYTTTLSTWNTTSYQTGFTHVFSLPAGLDNQAAAYVRLVDTSTTSINGGTVASTGTQRVDNVYISEGQVPQIPEPASIALFCMGGCALLGVSRRPKS